MRAPQPQTLNEALCLASAIRHSVGTQRWAWAEFLVHDAWNNGTFQKMVDSDWETRWTDDQCAAIAAMYRLTK